MSVITEKDSCDSMFIVLISSFLEDWEGPALTFFIVRGTLQTQRVPSDSMLLDSITASSSSQYSG